MTIRIRICYANAKVKQTDVSEDFVKMKKNKCPNTSDVVILDSSALRCAVVDGYQVPELYLT